MPEANITSRVPQDLSHVTVLERYSVTTVPAPFSVDHGHPAEPSGARSSIQNRGLMAFNLTCWRSTASPNKSDCFERFALFMIAQAGTCDQAIGTRVVDHGHSPSGRQPVAGTGNNLDSVYRLMMGSAYFALAHLSSLEVRFEVSRRQLAPLARLDHAVPVPRNARCNEAPSQASLPWFGLVWL